MDITLSPIRCPHLHTIWRASTNWISSSSQLSMSRTSVDEWSSGWPSMNSVWCRTGVCSLLFCYIILFFICFATICLSSLIHYQVLVQSCRCTNSVFSNSYVKKSCCPYIVRDVTKSWRSHLKYNELVICFLSHKGSLWYMQTLSIHTYIKHMFCLYLFPCVKRIGDCNS
jgi:hypothetical protein